MKVERFLKQALAATLVAGSLWVAPAPLAAEADDTLSTLVEVLKEADDPQFQLDILKGLTDALKGRRAVPMPEGWRELEPKLVKSGNSEIKTLARNLALTFGSEQALKDLRGIARDKSAETSTRRTAIETLLGVKDSGLAPILRDLLSESALRGSALKGLALYDDAETPTAILNIYDQLGTGEKRDALNALSSRPAYARELLTAVQSDRISRKDLTADLIRQLRNLKTADLDEKITVVWGAFRDSPADRQNEMARYKKIYLAGGSQPGDAMRGRVQFSKTCQQCHTLFGVGGNVGPDLTGSNRADLDYILQNIIDPNAVIPNDYRSSTIETKDDRILTGVIKKRENNSITIATATETAVVPKTEIASIVESALSMMPEGLLAQLNDQEVRDLIYYLSRPGQVPLRASKETVAGFFNGKDLAGWDGDEALWRVENGEIIGQSKTGLKRNDFVKSQMLFKDFRLICKIKLTPNKENSGIQFRSQPLPDGEMKGYQADAGAGWWGKLYEEGGRGILWDKSGESFVHRDGWNTYEVLAIGHKIQTAINGNISVDMTDPEGGLEGVIAIQLHAGGPLEVHVKDIEVEVDPNVGLKTVK